MKYVISVLFLVLAGCGYQGPVGPQGSTGASCTVQQVPVNTPGALNGGALITCGNNTTALLLNGTNGTNGTVVTPVQFCPNVTPTYPTTFPEFGFLINGTMYGVYSANDGFLAALPAGYYASNAVGSACDFTINSDGTVTN